jgi:hypothetical protein
MQQRKAIDDVNVRCGKQFRLLQGIEANIDAAGQLGLTDDEAVTFDVVLAAPHSRLRRSEDQTDRMLAAVAHQDLDHTLAASALEAGCLSHSTAMRTPPRSSCMPRPRSHMRV